MKLYCILHDTMPFIKSVIDIAEQKSLTILRQVGGCYTFSSLTEMFTGRLSCDLLETGFGYATRLEYKNPKTKELKFPWTSMLITTKFRNAGWKIHVHHPHVYNNMIDTDPNNEYSKIFSTSTGKECLLRQSARMQSCYEAEKSYIASVQSKKCKENVMYFFYYDLFHASVMMGKYDKEAEDRVKELTEYWDFTEPDVMFWIFSDHGTWLGLEGYPLPIHYLSWVLFRDNVEPSIDVGSRFISIRDFYSTVINKFVLGSNVLSVSDICSIATSQDKNRIYYVEDGRAVIDLLHSTTAIACKFVDWNDNKPGGILQVTYHKPDDRFVGVRTTLDSFGFVEKVEKVQIDNILREAITTRFRWIS